MRAVKLAKGSAKQDYNELLESYRSMIEQSSDKQYFVWLKHINNSYKPQIKELNVKAD